MFESDDDPPIWFKRLVSDWAVGREGVGRAVYAFWHTASEHKNPGSCAQRVLQDVMISLRRKPTNFRVGVHEFTVELEAVLAEWGTPEGMCGFCSQTGLVQLFEAPPESNELAGWFTKAAFDSRWPRLNPHSASSNFACVCEYGQKQDDKRRFDTVTACDEPLEGAAEFWDQVGTLPMPEEDEGFAAYCDRLSRPDVDRVSKIRKLAQRVLTDFPKSCEGPARD